MNGMHLKISRQPVCNVDGTVAGGSHCLNAKLHLCVIGQLCTRRLSMKPKQGVVDSMDKCGVSTCLHEKS